MAKPKINIVLCMIVGTEEKIIQRCLTAVKDVLGKYLKGICISYNKNDKTADLIKEFATAHDIPLKLVWKEWTSFRDNRNHSLDLGREFVDEKSLAPQRTYFLLLDADMILRKRNDELKLNLVNEAYVLQQETPGNVHDNIRLIRADCKTAKCVRRTHEYWSGVPVNSERCQELWIDDKNDGGNKSDKYDRDIKLLGEDLIDAPHDERSEFYLQQTYHNRGRSKNPTDMEDIDKSIEYGMLRIDKNRGWIEETWYAYYTLVKCFIIKKEYGKALEFAFKAKDLYPKRAEALYIIGKAYREISVHSAAYVALKEASKISYPVNDKLFLERDVYSAHISNELAIVAYYVGKRAEGLIHVHKPLYSKSSPSWLKHAVVNTLIPFYSENQKGSYLPIQVELPILDDNSGRYSPINPSIIKLKDGYIINCRFGNYVQRDGKHHLYTDSSNELKAKNTLVYYSFNWKYEKEVPLEIPGKTPEDVRLVEFNGKIWCTATCYNTGKPQIYLGRIEDSKVTNFVKLESPTGAEIEKNWLPLVHNNKLTLIYSHSPYTLLYPTFEKDVPTGKCTIVKPTVNFDAPQIRGSCSPVQVGEEYVGLIHLVAFDKGLRKYYFQWVFYDKDLIPTACSNTFNIKGCSVEFSCGMCLNKENDSILVGLGIEDRDVTVFKMPLKEVLTKKIYKLN